jgi:phosphate starvation-inducible protein PhoH and related proteins
MKFTPTVEQPIDCKVQTINGEKDICSVEIGEDIFTATGVGKITNKIFLGLKDTYKISFRDGTSFFCSSDTEISVFSSSWNKSGKYKRKNIKYLLNKGLYYKCGAKFKAKILSSEFGNDIELPIDPYLLGLLLGDGCLVGKTPQLSFGDKDKEVIDIIKERNPDYKINPRKTSEYGYQTSITMKDNLGFKNPLMVSVRELGIDVKSHLKFIPKKYLTCGFKQRLFLLRGIMDSDGSCWSNRTRVSSTSKELINDIKYLVQSLGGIAINHKPTEKVGKSKVYHLNIKMNINPFLIESKACFWKKSTKNPPSRYIVDIEYIGLKENIMLEVDDGENSYITNDFIIIQ